MDLNTATSDRLVHLGWFPDWPWLQH